MLMPQRGTTFFQLYFAVSQSSIRWETTLSYAERSRNTEVTSFLTQQRQTPIAGINETDFNYKVIVLSHKKRMF